MLQFSFKFPHFYKSFLHVSSHKPIQIRSQLSLADHTPTDNDLPVLTSPIMNLSLALTEPSSSTHKIFTEPLSWLTEPWIPSRYCPWDFAVWGTSLLRSSTSPLRGSWYCSWDFAVWGTSLLHSSTCPLHGSWYCPWDFAVRENWVSSSYHERR